MDGWPLAYQVVTITVRSFQVAKVGKWCSCPRIHRSNRIASNAMDHKAERDKDVEKILSSTHDRRVVVAGPGTGKSFLFQEAIRKTRTECKDKFLAITFIGKLGDFLADDLAGLAETKTLHGFARQFVLSKWKGAEYYPKIGDIIIDDLTAMETPCSVGDPEYKKRTEYYKAVGDNDVVHYALEICRKELE